MKLSAKSCDASRVTDDDVVAVLTAVAARLLPSDPSDAVCVDGAREARIDRYLKRALLDPFLVDVGPFLRAAASHLHGARFLDVDDAARDAMLRSLASGAPIAGVDGSVFVRVMTLLTIEGFLADPKYGGNHDRVGWRALAFDPRGRT